MTHEQEMLARAMSHIDDELILAAHAPRKKLRRAVPVLIAACLMIVVAVSFPYLREVIDTDLVLRGPLWNKEEQNEDVVIPDAPDKDDLKGTDISVTIGGTTVTMTDVTETTASFTLVKTDDVPLHAMLYDRLNAALASTESDHKEDGVTIRPHTLRLYVNGASEPVYAFPTAPGTYEVVVDFTVIRNGIYPMQEFMGLYAHIGEDGEAVTVMFSLEVVPDTTEATTATEPVETATEAIDTE